jgi:hypothetical protein
LAISCTTLVYNSKLVTLSPFPSVILRLKKYLSGDSKLRVTFSSVRIRPSLNFHSNVYGTFPNLEWASNDASSPTVSTAF